MTNLLLEQPLFNRFKEASITRYIGEAFAENLRDEYGVPPMGKTTLECLVDDLAVGLEAIRLFVLQNHFEGGVSLYYTNLDEEDVQKEL